MLTPAKRGLCFNCCLRKTETTADADRTNDAGTAEADAADLPPEIPQEGKGTVTGVVEEAKQRLYDYRRLTSRR